MADQWDAEGPERRAVDQRFEKSMADVRALKTGVADLADAVRIKSDTLHRIMVRMGYLFVGLFVALMLMSFMFITMLNRHMDDGHRRIMCHIELTAEQKAALGDLACK